MRINTHKDGVLLHYTDIDYENAKINKYSGNGDLLNSVQLSHSEIIEFNQLQKDRRKNDFKNESDVLFLKYQAGEISKQTWINSRNEIMERYKYINENPNETASEREQRLNQEAQQQFIEKANELDDKLIEKYDDFYQEYVTTIQEAVQENPNIPTNITYKALIEALMGLEGEKWVKKAFALNLLWQDVVVESRRTPSEAFELLPYMEYRRDNES